MTSSLRHKTEFLFSCSMLTYLLAFMGNYCKWIKLVPKQQGWVGYLRVKLSQCNDVIMDKR